MTKDFFSDLEIAHYQRQLLLPEVGGIGQQKLKKAKILVIGAGGLGSPALLYLAGAGIGTIGIIDHDKVEISNLQRQILFNKKDIAASKALCAKRRLEAVNPFIKIIEHNLFLDETNIKDLLTAYDIILDGCDNFQTRYLVADWAESLKKPLISGAITQFKGSVTVFMPYHDNKPRYRDLFPLAPPATYAPPCHLAGVIGPVPGIIGSLQAMEAMKLILHIGKPLIGRLLIYDALTAEFKQFTYERAKN